MSGGPHASLLLMLAAGLALAAMTGSAITAVVSGQHVVLRIAHLTMAAAMVPMLVAHSVAVSVAALIALIVLAVPLTGHVVRVAAGRGCLADVAGMASVLMVSVVTRWTAPALVVVVAASWMALSLLARRREASSTGSASWFRRWEALTAVTGATAMAMMALAMAPG